MISKKALDEFKAIWKKEFVEEISDVYALDSATKLLTLTDIVYRQIEKEHDDISFEHEEDKKFFC